MFCCDYNTSARPDSNQHLLLTGRECSTRLNRGCCLIERNIKASVSNSFCGMRHAFCFYDVSYWQFECVFGPYLAYIMNCNGQPMNTSLTDRSGTYLLYLGMNCSLDLGRTHTKNLESGVWACISSDCAVMYRPHTKHVLKLSQQPVEIECVAHPQRDRLTPTYIVYHLYIP